MGRDAASSMVREFDEYFAIRFGHIKEAFLDILRQNVSDAMLRDDHSPILVARADYTVFMENVRDTKEQMRGEMMSHMCEWTSAFEEMGLGRSRPRCFCPPR
jgi:hypothetical protein